MKSENHQQLQSYSHNHSIWHQLSGNKVKGNELKCPRVRKIPNDNQSSINIEEEIEKNDGNKIKNSKMENWIYAEKVNFSYQDLGHAYQINNFMRILKTLKSCKELQLVDNSISDLHNLELPKCETLNLRKNLFKSLNDLPKCPRLKHLNLTENNISSLNGSSRFNDLIALDLSRNPINFEVDFQKKILQYFPKLKELNGIQIDEAERLNFVESKTCLIS